MTALQLRQKRQRLHSTMRRQRAERRGSTLLIVLVLMAMLASLGVIFYVFAAQERASANYYSDAAKVKQFDIDADTLFDFGIRQVIEGPDIGKFRNSALSGRRHALLPNMLGLNTDGQKLDFAPFNGSVLPSTDSRYLQINDSAGANGGTERTANQLANLDPDYTYPDNNNVFLSYDGYDPIQGRRIIIPSFHRPQSTAFRTSPTWYSDSGTTNQVLRPHANHKWTPRQGQQPPSPAKGRYLTASEISTLGGTWTGWGVFPTTPLDWDGDGNVGEQGIWSTNTLVTAGTSLPATADNAEYDVDNDGDGIKEGVWLDLDFPLLEDASGMQYVPFYSFTIKEADALLNLNVHGNMARVWNGDVNLNTVPFQGSATDPFLSKSNQALSPAEINPLWALNRRPPINGGSASADNDGAFGADPFFAAQGAALPVNWTEAANREWMYLLMGRYSTSPSDLVPGRWGEEHLLYRAINNSSPMNPLYFSINSGSGSVLADPWPGPGQTQIDDNGDTQKVTGDWYGSTYQVFGQPLDYTGLGSYWTSSKSPNYGPSSPGSNPARWPLYNRYSSSSSAAVQWPGSGLSNTLQYGLFNDAGEVVIDADSLKDEDDQFGPDEMRALFLSDSNNDFAKATGGQTRLTQLAPYNINVSPTSFSGRTSQEFRGKFTTRSWDRKQFSLGYNTNRSWEFSADADQNATGSNPQQGKEFPPKFGTPTEYSSKSGATQGDLFRPVLRRLVEVEVGNFSQQRYQLRLNLNQLLVGPSGNPIPTVPSGQRPPNIQLNYRPLTPHPDQTTLTAAAIGTQAAYPANGNFTSPQHQEYWARVDRQLMARDIFCLMYALTWPDGVNPTLQTGGTQQISTSASTFNAAIRQLAQYAVNVVDAVDRDNVVTRFEYDTMPWNGWGLDDNPYGTVGSDTDRADVYGVERLDLTLSEALAVHAEHTTSNLPFTQWDDNNDQHFSYVELRNPGPSDVSLSTRAWQVEVGLDYTDTTLAATAADLMMIRRLQLRAGTVSAGQLFTIGSADTTVGGSYPSIMKVDASGGSPSDSDMTTWIAPAQQTLNLDLKDPAASTRFNLTDATNAAVGNGSLYDSTIYTKLSSSPSTPLYVRLYRRVSPNRPFPNSTTEEDDNPFVLVDEIALNDIGTSTKTGRGGKLEFVSGDTTISTQLGNLRSRRHAEPMSTDNINGNAYTTATGVYANTLANNNGTVAFTNWQKVFDRDFASSGELLQLTLGGFSNLETLRTNGYATGNALGRAAMPGVITSIVSDSSITGGWYVSTGTASTAATIGGAAEKFFMPVPQSGTAAGPPRWHRLLEMVEVPSRMHAGIPGFPNPLDYSRVPGKMNINMLRHPENFAAMLDDINASTLYVDEDWNLDGTLTGSEDLNSNSTIDPFKVPLFVRRDQTQPGSVMTGYTDYTLRTIGGNQIKSWWDGLIASRDGQVSSTAAMVTPYNPSVSNDPTGLFLPGLPANTGSNLTGSRPFRSFAAADQGTGRPFATTQDTLLRAWPGDDANATAMGTADPRGLFELGTQDEHRGQDSLMNTVPKLDPYVRSRLLNKVMNQVTTRSNVFVVFASVKYFRANVDSATGAVQIGGPLKPPPNSSARFEPELRRFYVVDRSQIEKAYDPQSKSFNFRALIEFYQDLQ